MDSIDAQRRTYQTAQSLHEFWQRAVQARSRQGRLSLLRRWVQLVFAADPYLEHSTPAARQHFQRRKQRGHFRLKGWCWVCETETPDHRHHIIPLKAGGRNRVLNVVPLCESCHRDVHQGAEATARYKVAAPAGDSGV